MKILVFSLFVAILSTSPPAAASGECRYLGGLEASPAMGPGAGCIMGNLNAPAFPLEGEDAWRPFPTFMFNPRDYSCSCTEGFRIDAIHFVVAFSGSAPEQVSFSPRLAHGFPLTVPPPECHEPTDYFVTPGLYPWAVFFGTAVVTFDRPGYYEVIVDAGIEACAYLDYSYGISLFGFEGTPNVHPVTDDSPGHCPDFAFASMGSIYWWIPLDAPGNLVVWANVTCCGNPVETEPSAWGGVKAMFR